MDIWLNTITSICELKSIQATKQYSPLVFGNGNELVGFIKAQVWYMEQHSLEIKVYVPY
jgi:hypothetical protein